MKKWLKGGIVGGGIGVLFSLMAWIFFLVENKMAITNTFVFGIEQIILFPLWFIGSLAGIIVFYIILGFGLGALIGYLRSKHNDSVLSQGSESNANRQVK